MTLSLEFFLAVTPPTLTSIACLFLLFKYIQQKEKTLGFSLITVLAASDLIFAIITFVSIFFYQGSVPPITLDVLFFSMSFSIGFASAIAFLVYQSLANKNFDSKKQTIRAFVGTFILSCLFTFYWNLDDGGVQELISLFLPLALSLSLTLIFYIKSINLLREQQWYSLNSTKSYIKSLACYSFVQLFTYGPLILYLFFSGFIEFGEYWSAVLTIITQNLAGLSGFFSALIFLCQGSFNHKEPLIDKADCENEFTQDLF